KPVRDSTAIKTTRRPAVKILISLAALILALTACSQSQGQTATRPSAANPTQAAPASQTAPNPLGGQTQPAANGPAVVICPAESSTSSRPGTGPPSTRLRCASPGLDSLTL